MNEINLKGISILFFIEWKMRINCIPFKRFASLGNIYLKQKMTENIKHLIGYIFHLKFKEIIVFLKSAIIFCKELARVLNGTKISTNCWIIHIFHGEKLDITLKKNSYNFEFELCFIHFKFNWRNQIVTHWFDVRRRKKILLSDGREEI